MVMEASRLRVILLAAAFLFHSLSLPAEQISVRHKDGVAHGFLATGDQIQVVRGDRVTSAEFTSIVPIRESRSAGFTK
jgi:hypothetical protein